MLSFSDPLIATISIGILAAVVTFLFFQFVQEDSKSAVLSKKSAASAVDNDAIDTVAAQPCLQTKATNSQLSSIGSTKKSSKKASTKSSSSSKKKPKSTSASSKKSAKKSSSTKSKK